MTFALRARLAVRKAVRASIAFRASASVSANTSSTALSIPGSIQPGDVMILAVGWSSASGQTFTSPSGWTPINAAIDDQSQIASRIFYRVAAGGDAGSGVILALSAVANITGIISCYQNVDSTNPIDVYAGVAEGATSLTTHDTPSVISTVSDGWLISAVFDKASPATTSWNHPGGQIERENSYNTSNPGVTGALGDELLSAIGATGARQWTADASTARAIMWSIVLRPGTQVSGGGGSQPTGDGIYVTAAGANGTQAVLGAGALDERLANRVGRSTPFLKGEHTYSGNNFPSTFSTSNARFGQAYGYPISILNVKCDWTQLSNGGMDDHITNFVNSIPAGHVVYLIINHEPENDGNPAGSGVWRSGQARAANLIASLNDPRCIYAVCHMTYTWKAASGRNPEDWNPTGGMTTAALNRAVFAPDGYTTVRNSSGTTIDTMASEFTAPFAAAQAWGFSKFAISEHSMNNDIGAPTSACVNWWNSDHLPYLRSINNLVYYAFYNHTGPASGTNSNLDTPEEELMFGTFAAEQNDLIG